MDGGEEKGCFVFYVFSFFDAHNTRPRRSRRLVGTSARRHCVRTVPPLPKKTTPELESQGRCVR